MCCVTLRHFTCCTNNKKPSVGFKLVISRQKEHCEQFIHFGEQKLNEKNLEALLRTMEERTEANAASRERMIRI